MFNKKKLAAYLKDNGITQASLAKKFGVTEGTIRHIVVGLKQPSLAMTKDFADLMGCTVDDLVVDDDNDGE